MVILGLRFLKSFNLDRVRVLGICCLDGTTFLPNVKIERSHFVARFALEFMRLCHNLSLTY